MGDRLRIVVADDNEMMRENLRRWLYHLGHDVSVVGGGEALVEVCRLTDLDVVFSDVQMPDLDGIAATETIRRWSLVPIVLLSGVWDDDSLERAATAGATRCAPKPVRPLELVALLNGVRDDLRRSSISAGALVRRFIETVPEYAVFTLDVGGCVTSWNLGSEEAFGYTAAQIVGRIWTCLFPPSADRAERCDEVLAAATRSGRVETPCGFVTQAGIRVRTPVVVAALRDPDGRLCGFGAIARSWVAESDAAEKMDTGVYGYPPLRPV